ncbi:hypothetical protein IMY05_C4749000500 [Salix suchowensis]|nr:hypothetical protein IMY05_C4749000500 [Salix suchowensis]
MTRITNFRYKRTHVDAGFSADADVEAAHPRLNVTNTETPIQGPKSTATPAEAEAETEGLQSNPSAQPPPKKKRKRSKSKKNIGAARVKENADATLDGESAEGVVQAGGGATAAASGAAATTERTPRQKRRDREKWEKERRKQAKEAKDAARKNTRPSELWDDLLRVSRDGARGEGLSHHSQRCERGLGPPGPWSGFAIGERPPHSTHIVIASPHNVLQLTRMFIGAVHPPYTIAVQGTGRPWGPHALRVVLRVFGEGPLGFGVPAEQGARRVSERWVLQALWEDDTSCEGL